MDVSLECLVKMEGPWANGASEWTVGSCSVVTRHHSGPEAMDDGGVKLPWALLLDVSDLGVARVLV